MKEKSKIPLILGAVTLLLFAVRPYILELIEPSKSIGQVVGENAKDLMVGIYLSHLAISVVAFLIIALLAVIIFVLAGHYL